MMGSSNTDARRWVVNPTLSTFLQELYGAGQAHDAGEREHQPTAEGLVAEFGTEAPDGVRLVVASRVDRFDPG